MPSARKIKTNRANSRLSTGPNTAQGKTHAAQNARRHGLSVSILLNPVLSAEAENLAREIAGEGASPEIRGLARRVAEAQVDVIRVSQARLSLLSRNLNGLEYTPHECLRTLDATLKIIARHMRRLGPETPLPPEVAQLAYYVLHWKPDGAEKFVHILLSFAYRRPRAARCRPRRDSCRSGLRSVRAEFFPCWPAGVRFRSGCIRTRFRALRGPDLRWSLRRCRVRQPSVRLDAGAFAMTASRPE